MSLVQNDLTLLVASVVGVLAVARVTRLWIYDAWPPMVWLRDRFGAWTDRGGDWRAGWKPLGAPDKGCPFCVAPYFALASLAWFIAAGAQHGSPFGGPWASATWWQLHTWLAASYVVSMVVVRDEPADS